MHNTYISSTISLRCKNCPSFSFNDSSYLLNNYRFGANPFPFSSPRTPSCCSYCANCANPVYKLSLNPSICYGLRQSSLIQWSPYTRFTWGGLDRGYLRFLVSDFDEKCDLGRSYCVNERKVCGRNGRRFGDFDEKCDFDRPYYYNKRRLCGRKGGWLGDFSEKCDCGRSDYYSGSRVFGRKGMWGKVRSGYYNGSMVLEERRQRHILCNEDEAEVMLSLLTDEVGVECFDVRERNRRSSRKIEVEDRGNGVKSGHSWSRRRIGDSGASVSDSRSICESVRFKSGDEDQQSKEDKRVEERRTILKGEDRRARARSGGSSCSSYHSIESGEFESDIEVEVKHEDYLQESASAHKWDSARRGTIRYDNEFVEEVGRQDNFAEEDRVIIKQENTARGSYKVCCGAESDWRKKSEKKLAEVSMHEHEFKTESLDKHSTFSEIYKSDHKMTSSCRQYDSRKGKSNSAVTVDEGTRGEYRLTSDQVTAPSEPKMKSKQLTELVEIHGSDAETILTSPDQHRRSQENLPAAVNFVRETRGDQHVAAGRLTKQNEFRKQSQQFAEVSGRQEMDVRGTTTSQISVDGTRELHRQAGHRVIKEISDTRNADIETSKRLDLRNQGEDGSSSSTVHYSDSKSVSIGQEILENRTSNKEFYSATELKSVAETKERHNISDQEMLNIGLRKELHMRRHAEEITSQASLKKGFQSEVQQFRMDERNNTASLTITVPPSQLVARDPTNVHATMGTGLTATQESSSALQHELYGQAGWEGTHGGSHGGVLGSADELQKSSMHHGDEFVEKVRHEVSTSDIQQENKSYDTKTAYKDEQKKVSSHSSSGDPQSKDHDSSLSSRSSAAKGPSDAMWDVTDGSRQQSPEIDVPVDATTAKNTTVKRSGRSLWNIIADVAHLLWHSRSRSHSSTSKSGGKSSPHQSTGSEAFYSGHELDESGDEHTKKERKEKALEPISLDLQTGGIPSQSQGEGSSPTKAKNNTVTVMLESPSFRTGVDSGLTSKGHSSSSTEETSRINIADTSSGSAQAELSFPPAVRSRRSPAVREVLESGNFDAPSSSSGTGLSKRGRLLRNDHLLKDKFDEWEEAFIHENERRKVDEIFMREALVEAKKAADIWEVPVGAVLVRDGQVIARGYNLVEELRDSTAHAEMICIREASKALRTWRLSESTLYVTIEPCPMCAGAILQARIDTVVWGAPNKLLGADGSWIRLFPIGCEEGTSLEPSEKPAAPVHPFHPKIAVRRGVLATECADAMQQFFRLRRKKQKKHEPESPPPSCLPIANHPSKLLAKMHDAFHFMFCL